MFCVVAATSSAVCRVQRSSAQSLLLAHSVELHPLTTLSPVLQPWKPSQHARSSTDTGSKTHTSIIVVRLSHWFMSAAALLR